MASIQEVSPSDDFFSVYAKYTQGQESPQAFHFWTAVGILSGICGRNILLDRGYYTLYPNHYIVLSSGSALCRKSTALGIGVRILKDALGRLRGEDGTIITGLPTILSSKMTPEALCRALSRKGIDSLDGTFDENALEGVSRPVVLYSSELGVFMSKASQASGLVDLLIDFYDCPDEWEYITKTQGTDLVHNVYASLLAATTPNWIADNVTSSVFNQGLVGRTIFVYADKPNLRVGHPEYTKQEAYYKDVLAEHLASIASLSGSFVENDEAREAFDDWYTQREEPDDTNDGASGFFGREHDHVLKLAMIFSIARRQTLVIHKEDILDAIQKIAEVRISFNLIFREVVYEREIFEVKYVEGMLQEVGEIGRSKLMKKVYKKMNGEKLDECLKALEASGLVESSVRKSAKGPSSTWYKYTGEKK